VHEDQGRTRGRFLEPRREPTQTLRAEEAAHSPRIERVERDEPYRMALDHVVHEPPAAREIGVIGERGGERVAIVVVARDQIDRHRERCQQVVKPSILLG